jgi:hypothetical protein
MSDTDDRLEALRQEWLARHEAALRHRTATRTAAADAAFRAYSAQRGAAVPPQRRPAGTEQDARAAARAAR